MEAPCLSTIDCTARAGPEAISRKGASEREPEAIIEREARPDSRATPQLRGYAPNGSMSPQAELLGSHVTNSSRFFSGSPDVP